MRGHVGTGGQRPFTACILATSTRTSAVMASVGMGRTFGSTSAAARRRLPARAAVGYLTVDGPRTNVFHLPVRGTGDGGMYSTVADIHALWAALFAGRIVPEHRVSEMIRPQSSVPSESMRYGLGFWLHESDDAVVLEGYDAGVSFRTVHDPVEGYTHTVISNWSDGAWPIARHLDDLLAP